MENEKPTTSEPSSDSEPQSKLLDATHHLCDDCRLAFLLLVRIGEDLLCAVCWRRRRCPNPIPGQGRWAAEAQELETREKMLKRKGEDRYRVRAGKT